MNNPEVHWRMWLLGSLATETGAALTTLYGLYDSQSSDVGREMRSAVKALATMQASKASADNVLNAGMTAVSRLAKRFRLTPPCEACGE